MTGLLSMIQVVQYKTFSKDSGADVESYDSEGLADFLASPSQSSLMRSCRAAERIVIINYGVTVQVVSVLMRGEEWIP
jgi:hypothetical protein